MSGTTTAISKTSPSSHIGFGPRLSRKDVVPLVGCGLFRWQLGAQSTVLCPVAYDRAKLVGSFFSIPRTLRVGSSILSIGLASWLMVDPAYRASRLALRLIEALRQRHDELGLAFSLAVINADPASTAYRFLDPICRDVSGNLHSLFPLRQRRRWQPGHRLGRGRPPRGLAGRGIHGSRRNGDCARKATWRLLKLPSSQRPKTSGNFSMRTPCRTSVRRLCRRPPCR